MGKYVCLNALAELRGLNTRMLKVSFGQLKLTCNTRIIHFDYSLEQLLSWTRKKLKKKSSLRKGKLKANRASETEEQRKERLRIRIKKR